MKMRNARKIIGLLFLFWPLYRYVMDWREEEKIRKAKGIA